LNGTCWDAVFSGFRRSQRLHTSLTTVGCSWPALIASFSIGVLLYSLISSHPVFSTTFQLLAGLFFIPDCEFDCQKKATSKRAVESGCYRAATTKEHAW